MYLGIIKVSLNLNLQIQSIYQILSSILLKTEPRPSVKAKVNIHKFQD